MLKVVSCRAKKDGWVDLVRWEILFRKLLWLRSVKLLLIDEEELEDAKT